MSDIDFDLSPPTPEQRRTLEANLTGEERDVLLNHGTERPFCGVLLDNKKPGAYCCKLCGLPLFTANQKFESGTGWPRFTAPLAEKHLTLVVDNSFGTRRTEMSCARCRRDQDHMLPSRPAPT